MFGQKFFIALILCLIAGSVANAQESADLLPKKPKSNQADIPNLPLQAPELTFGCNQRIFTHDLSVAYCLRNSTNENRNTNVLEIDVASKTILREFIVSGSFCKFSKISLGESTLYLPNYRYYSYKDREWSYLFTQIDLKSGEVETTTLKEPTNEKVINQKVAERGDLIYGFNDANTAIVALNTKTKIVQKQYPITETTRYHYSLGHNGVALHESKFYYMDEDDNSNPYLISIDLGSGKQRRSILYKQGKIPDSEIDLEPGCLLPAQGDILPIVLTDRKFDDSKPKFYLFFYDLKGNKIIRRPSIKVDRSVCDLR